MNEQQLQADVQRLLVRLGDRGVVWHHCARPRYCHGPGGLPDVVAAGPGGLVLAELKSAAGELSAGQQAWHWALDRGHYESFVWRPADWAAGRIQAALESLTG